MTSGQGHSLLRCRLPTAAKRAIGGNSRARFVGLDRRQPVGGSQFLPVRIEHVNQRRHALGVGAVRFISRLLQQCDLANQRSALVMRLDKALERILYVLRRMKRGAAPRRKRFGFMALGLRHLSVDQGRRWKNIGPLPTGAADDWLDHVIAVETSGAVVMFGVSNKGFIARGELRLAK